MSSRFINRLYNYLIDIRTIARKIIDSIMIAIIGCAPSPENIHYGRIGANGNPALGVEPEVFSY